MDKQILRNIIFIGLFLVPFVPFLVSSSFFFPFITTKAFTWRIIVEIIFAAWVILALLDQEYRPKKSYILYAVLTFIGIIGLADLFGVSPMKSFWSNFERMEGYILLLHLGAFFLVISSVFREIHWKRWWNTSLVAAFLMVLYCLLQLAGLKTINQGGVRVDGTLGNATYLAVYMLFHIFIAVLFLWRERSNKVLAWIYGLLALSYASILYYTATRGAILGLLGGILVVAILNVRNRENPQIRKVSIGALAALIVLVGGFFAIRDAAFIKNSPVLSRFSTLSLSEIKSQGRYFIWPMAIEGVKERPILGWGQENFNYIFQKHYQPEMFNLEPWFDRAHNIFLDWAVAGGVLGLLAYLSLYGALFYLIWTRANFSHTEKSLLTGLVLSYFFHSFFVFDHLISYILFFSLLAYVHYRSNTDLLWQKSVPLEKATSIVIPAAVIVLLFSLYFLNIKPIRGNTALINALFSLQTAETVSGAPEHFKNAYNSSRLGRPETAEQMSSNSIKILSSGIPVEDKNNFFLFAKDAILRQNKEIKNDARLELVAGSLLSSTGYLDEALTHLEKAKELMPGKQQIYFEIGSAYINKNDPAKALAAFKEAYDMAPDYIEARIIYLIGAIFAKDRVLEEDLLSQIDERTAAFEDRLVTAYYSNKRYAEVIALLEKRSELDPANASRYADYIQQVRALQK